MSCRRRLAILAAVGLLLGCQQQGPARRAGAPPPGLSVAQLKAEGDALARDKKWEAAVVKYQAAVNREPSHAAIRTALAVALSHLDRRQETVEQFRWVLTYGPPASPEVAMARSWLANAGELADSARALARSAAETPATEPSKGTLRGRTEWPGVDPRDRLVPIRISLVGDDPTNREVRRDRRFRLGDGFGFSALESGRYRLVALATDSEARLWDQMVTIEPGKETVLDLTPATSPVSPSTFPPPKSE